MDQTTTDTARTSYDYNARAFGRTLRDAHAADAPIA
jgi:hypothetical protein